MTDLRDEFEAAFAAEPPLRAVDDAVVAGRGALRRRRVGIAATACAVVATLMLGATQLADDSPRRESPVGQPEQLTPEERERRLTEAAVIDRSWRDQCGLASQPSCEEYVATAAPVGIGPDGGLLRISADVIIVRQAVDGSPPAGGLRIAVEVRTPLSVNPRWWVLTREADGTVTAQLADPSASRISFERWARAVHDGRRPAGAPELTERPAVIG